MTPPEGTITDLFPNHTTAFEVEADAVVRELRYGLVQVIEGIRPRVAKASDLRRRLDLGQKVSWGLYTAAMRADGRGLPALMPGRRGMERFLEAAAQNGVAPEPIARVRATFERFEASVAKHAGSRDAFETMVADLGGGRREETGSDIRHKRAIYRAMSILWGRQVRVACGATIRHPSDTPGMMDRALVRGMVGLRRTRAGGPLYTTPQMWRKPDERGDPNERSPHIALDPREAPDSLGLLRDFCSQPLPEFRLTAEGEGFRKYELTNTKVGTAGEVTYFTGQVARNVSEVPSEAPETKHIHAKAIDTPTEMFIGDILVHRSLHDQGVPKVGVYAIQLDGTGPWNGDLLPMTERAEYLGDGVEAAGTPQIAQWPEILAYAIQRAGWNPAEFRVYRCRVEYPVMSTRIEMTQG